MFENFKRMKQIVPVLLSLTPLVLPQSTISPSVKKYEVAWQFPEKSYETELSLAIAKIIDEYMAASTTTLDVTLAPTHLIWDIVQRDLVTSIKYRSIDTKAYYIEYVDHLTERKNPRTYNLILIDGYESFLRVYEAMNENTFCLRGYYIIAITQVLDDYFQLVQKILKKLFEIFVVNVIVATEYKLQDSINLYTYYPFSKTRCREVVPVVYNTFKNGKFARNIEAFPQKFRNLHGCPLNVITWDYMPFMGLKVRDANGYPLGIDGKFLQVLSQALNFKWVIKIPPDDPQRGMIYPNGTTTGAVHMIVDGDGDFTMCAFGYTVERANLMSASVNYYTTDMVFGVPELMPYSSFERLFLPFGTYVWLMITLSFVLGFLVTTVLKLIGKPYMEFVVGRMNRASTLQMFNVYFGGTISTSPRRNFARTILMIWISATIILRSSYQGSLFKHLQSNQLRTRPGTARSLIDEGYKVYTLNHWLTLVDILKLKKDQYVIMDTDVAKYFEYLHDPNFRGIIVYTESDIMYHNTLNRTRTAIKRLPERIFNFPTSIYFKRNSYLAEQVDKVISYFLGSGLIDFWAAQILNRPYKEVIPHRLEPKRIIASDLLGCFEICLVLGLVAIGVFCLELLSVRCDRLRRIVEFYTY